MPSSLYKRLNSRHYSTSPSIVNLILLLAVFQLTKHVTTALAQKEMPWHASTEGHKQYKGEIL